MAKSHLSLLKNYIHAESYKKNIFGVHIKQDFCPFLYRNCSMKVSNDFVKR